MSKFDSVLAEAAYAVAGHGFTDEEFSNVQDSTGWNALVTVSATTLLNVGETEIRDRFLAEHSDAPLDGYLAWIRENDQGFVTLVTHGSDAGSRSGTDLVSRAWDAYVDEHGKIVCADCGQEFADTDAAEEHWAMTHDAEARRVFEAAYGEPGWVK